MSTQDAYASGDSDTSFCFPGTPTNDNGFVVVGTLTNARNALSTLTNMEEGTLQLVSVPLPGSPSERSLGILWRKVSSAPYFQSVRVRLTAAGQMVGEETLTWQKFPSSSAGMLSLSSIPSDTTRVAVELRLLPSDDPDSWKRLLTVQSFALPYKKVVVRHTAYTTYAATLVWLACRHIEFAPLKSRAGPKRKVQLRTQFEANSALPAPASPKSVYRLAQILELADLKQLALRNFAPQLAPDNAVNELFSNVISAFPELRESTLRYVSQKWAEVKKTASWKKAEDQAARNELPASAMLTAILLASRVA